MRIKDLPMETNDNKAIKETVESFMERNLKLHVKLKAVGKIGNKAIIVEMEDMTDKVNVLKSKFKDIKEYNIYIDQKGKRHTT